MAIGREEQTVSMFQTTSPIVIPATTKDGRSKDIHIRLSGNSHTLKSGLYHKRTNYRNKSFGSTSPNNSLKALHQWSFGSALQKPKHPLGDLFDDDGIEVYDCDPITSEEYDYSDDISICSCSTTSSSNYSPSFTHITRKSLSNSVISNVNIPLDFKHRSTSSSKSSDSLLRILNDFSEMDSKSVPRKNIVSNLTNSLKNWGLTIHRSSQSIWTYSLTPRMTDDVIPKNENFREESFQELTTFNIKQLPETELPVNPPACKMFRNRDQRINSTFLRLYSFDYNARINGSLPNTYSNDEIGRLISQKRALKKFHEKYDLFTLSETSREKLWHNVILPPRSDPSPGMQIDVAAYVYVGDDDEEEKHHPAARHSSLISSIGNCLPWNSSKSSFKPAGVLEHSRVRLNGQAPNSGITKTQFTVKGWCNSRWIETKLD